MKVERMVEIETNDIHVGDKIHVDHYTATCQEITQSVAVFLLDQFLDKPMEMNSAEINKGGYPESDLRKRLQSNEVLDIFKGIRDRNELGIHSSPTIARYKMERFKTRWEEAKRD